MPQMSGAGLRRWSVCHGLSVVPNKLVIRSCSIGQRIKVLDGVGNFCSGAHTHWAGFVSGHLKMKMRCNSYTGITNRYSATVPSSCASASATNEWWQCVPSPCNLVRSTLGNQRPRNRKALLNFADVLFTLH